MALTLLDPVTAAAVFAAETQDAQCEALVASWAGGDVTVLAMAGAVVAETATYRPWELTLSTPRELRLGAKAATTVNVAGQTVTSIVYRTAGTDIFSFDVPADVQLALPTTDDARRINLSAVVVTALHTLPVVVPPTYATALTVSFAASGVTGSPVIVTVTPNGAIPPGGGTSTLAADNGGVLGSAGMTWVAGATAAQTTTLNRVVDGTDVVTLTNNMGLLNTGSGASYTSSTPQDTPTYVQGLADFQVRNLTGAYAPANGMTTLHDVLPTEWRGGSASGIASEQAIFNAWNGGKGDSAGKRLFVHGAGHTDGANNGLYSFDFGSGSTPAGWVLYPNSLSALASVRYNTLYADNKPNAVHTYDQQWYDPVLNRWYRFGGSTWSLDGGATGTYYYDFGTQKWNCDPGGGFFSASNVPSKLGGTVLGNSDGSKLLWIDGDYPDTGYFYDSDGTAHLCALGMNRNSVGSGMVSVNIGGDNWLTLSVMSGSTWLYTHVVNWAANTIASTQRTHASHAAYLPGNASAAGSLVYDPYHSAGPCVWAFGLTRHCTGSTMSTQILRISLADYSITAYTMTGDAIATGASGIAGSYNRHVFIPQWRVVGTVHAFSAPMSLIKLPS